ncbi:hypothetical protein BH11MYX2_BH11MYX2_23410 [soil metagenome]
MSISSAPSPVIGRAVMSDPVVDAKLAKRFVMVCGAVPLLLLAWDAQHHQLGVNSANFAIHTTGLVGLVLLTLSLVITPLRHLTGQTWLVAARRNLGVLGFAYIGTHFLLFFGIDRAASISSTLEEIVTRKYLWFGTAALVIMIPLAITSTDAMITRLGPKRWKLLHRTAYLAVLGGVIHYYLLVKADVTKPFIFTVAFSGLMLFRVVDAGIKKLRPPVKKQRNFWAGEVVVKSITQETHDVKTFRFELPAGGSLPFHHTAGQYLNITLPISGKNVKRSYTISSSPRPEYVEISVKRAPAGYGSHYLHDKVVVGDRIKISAPGGKFHFPGVTGAHADKRVVLLAGGVGITPMMSVIRSLTANKWKCDIYLVFGVRTRDDVIFAAEIKAIAAANPNLHVTLHYSSEHGHITAQTFRTAIPDFTHGPVMMCGPGPMMAAMRTVLVGMGIPNAEIHEEAFISPTAPAEGDVGGGDASEIDAEATRAYQFKRAKKAVELPGGLSVLEAAEEAGVEIPFDCRSGICGQCKCTLVSGRVVMESTDALTLKDRANNVVLACQAIPVSDVVIDV